MNYKHQFWVYCIHLKKKETTIYVIKIKKRGKLALSCSFNEKNDERRVFVVEVECHEEGKNMTRQTLKMIFEKKKKKKISFKKDLEL